MKGEIYDWLKKNDGLEHFPKDAAIKIAKMAVFAPLRKRAQENREIFGMKPVSFRNGASAVINGGYAYTGEGKDWAAYYFALTFENRQGPPGFKLQTQRGKQEDSKDLGLPESFAELVGLTTKAYDAWEKVIKANLTPAAPEPEKVDIIKALEKAGLEVKNGKIRKTDAEKAKAIIVELLR